MAGISKRRTSPASSSSSSGDGMTRRITRKPRSARRGPRGGVRRPPAPRLAVNELDLNAAALDPDNYATGLRVLLQKELRNSDVSQLGRIVLPKKEAESYLPVLISKDGKSLCIYWPNNKSRMYVLENTGEYFPSFYNLDSIYCTCTFSACCQYSIVAYRVLYFVKVIGAKKAGYGQTATVPQIHEHMHIPTTLLPAPQVFHDYAAPVAPEDDMLAVVPQADEIFDGILNSLPEIPVANVRYSDFFDPFGDSMDMTNPLGSNHSVNLATHFHDEKTASSLFPYPKSGPLI
ncbi:hypothetical protein HU200_046284 [Digitaria exilis]|uniref:Uncharacterized protein n=1 Tax=Digitaria exilis TaxID=1010633 RepID=A0A835EDT3_9POAL|nr:hypothetical protein HU200_046284 [Digitaria exilis]